MQTEYDIAIIGAGPVGGALACALAARGKQVLLVDKAALPPMEHPDFDGRAYAIAAGSRRLLDAAGLWDALPFAPCPILDIDVTDGKPGRPPSPLQLHFDHRAVGDDPFGWIIEARSLRIAINQRLHESPNILLRAPAQADGDAPCRRRRRLAIAGEVSRPGWLWRRMGATANFAARPAFRSPAAYGQSAVVCAIAHEKPHHGVALEHFLPGGPFAQLPMSGNGEHPTSPPSSLPTSMRSSSAWRCWTMRASCWR